MRLWGPDSLKSKIPDIFRKLRETWFLSWNLNKGLAFPSFHLSFQHHTFSLRHRTVAVPVFPLKLNHLLRDQKPPHWLLSHVVHRELLILPLNYLSHTHRMEIISLLRKMVWLWHVAVTQLPNPVFSQIYHAIQAAFPAISDSWYA